MQKSSVTKFKLYQIKHELFKQQRLSFQNKYLY